ncbi:Ig-like domain-containing protein [Limnohabitans sp.]|uniref:Ig-like domain-containing protein n=1 Tax=Limnohabitans sp. TaxID=1907725 RepID=UPI00286F594B|nr:Ig-like domain-containing protein [Limnohabitans sp.]
MLYLKAGVTLDYENKASYAVTVNAVDSTISGSTPISTSYTLGVNNVNEAPTALATVPSQSGTVGVNFASLNLAGYFADPDIGDTRKYTITSGALPTGLVLDQNTGIVSGQPTTAKMGSVTVTMTDAGGLKATQNVGFYIAEATGIVLSLDSDTGVLGDDYITRDGHMSVSNLGSNAASWSYSMDGGATWQSGHGSSFIVPEGYYEAQVIQVRSLTSEGAVIKRMRLTHSLRVDQTVPDALRVQLLSDSATLGDGVTNDGSLTVSGLESAESTWQYNTTGVDSAENWHAGSGNSWVLAEDDYAPGQLAVRAMDAAGNVSDVWRNDSAWHIDTTPPLVPHATLAARNVVDGSQSVEVAQIEPGALWSYSLDGGSHWLNGIGSSFSLPSGDYAPGSVQVIQRDPAGNSSDAATLSWTADEANVAGHLVISSLRPSVRIESAAKLTLKARETSEIQFFFSEAVTDFSVESLAVQGGQLVGLHVDSTNASIWHATFVPSPKSSGQAVINVIDGGFMNTAGYKGQAASSAAIAFDTLVPNTLYLRLHEDTGRSDSDGVTSNPVIDLVGLETGARWQYSTDNGLHWAWGQGDQLVLADGRYWAGAIQVRQFDAAGNYSAQAQMMQSVLIDTVAPTTAPVLSMVAGNFIYQGNLAVNFKIALYDGLAVGDLLRVRVNGVLAGDPVVVTAADLASGQYTLRLSRHLLMGDDTSVGTCAVMVEHCDVAGNASASNSQTLQFIAQALNSTRFVPDWPTNLALPQSQALTITLRYPNMKVGDVVRLVRSDTQYASSNQPRVWVTAEDVQLGYIRGSQSANIGFPQGDYWAEVDRVGASKIISNKFTFKTELSGDLFSVRVRNGNGDESIVASELGDGLNLRLANFNSANGMVVKAGASRDYKVWVDGKEVSTISISAAETSKDISIPWSSVQGDGQHKVRIEGVASSGLIKGGGVSIQTHSHAPDVLLSIAKECSDMLSTLNTSITLDVAYVGMRAGDQISLYEGSTQLMAPITLSSAQINAGVAKLTVSRDLLAAQGIHSVHARITDVFGNTADGASLALRVDDLTPQPVLSWAVGASSSLDAPDAKTELVVTSVDVANNPLIAGDVLGLYSADRLLMNHRVSQEEAMAGQVTLTLRGADLSETGPQRLSVMLRDGAGQQAVSQTLNLQYGESQSSPVATPSHASAALSQQSWALKTGQGAWARLDQTGSFSSAYYGVEADIFFDASVSHAEETVLSMYNPVDGFEVKLKVLGNYIVMAHPEGAAVGWHALTPGWHHVALNFAGYIRIFALDGGVVYSNAGTYAPGMTYKSPLVGQQWQLGVGGNVATPDAPQTFNGLIANVRILSEYKEAGSGYYANSAASVPADNASNCLGYYSLDGQTDSQTAVGRPLTLLGVKPVDAFAQVPTGITQTPTLLPVHPTLTGTTTPSARVQVYQVSGSNELLVGETQADTRGIWRLDTSLGAGTQNVRIKTTATPAAAVPVVQDVKLDLRDSDVLSTRADGTQLRDLSLMSGSTARDVFVVDAQARGYRLLTGFCLADPLRPDVANCDQLDLRELLAGRYMSGVTPLSRFVRVNAGSDGQAVLAIDPLGSAHGEFDPTLWFAFADIGAATLQRRLETPEFLGQFLLMDGSGGLARIQASMRALATDQVATDHPMPRLDDYAQIGLSQQVSQLGRSQVNQMLQGRALQGQIAESALQIRGWLLDAQAALNKAARYAGGLDEAFTNEDARALGLASSVAALAWFNRKILQVGGVSANLGADLLQVQRVLDKIEARVGQASGPTLTADDVLGLGYLDVPCDAASLALLNDVLLHEFPALAVQMSHLDAVMHSLRALYAWVNSHDVTADGKLDTLSVSNLHTLGIEVAKGAVTLNSEENLQVLSQLAGVGMAGLQQVKDIQTLVDRGVHDVLSALSLQVHDISLRQDLNNSPLSLGSFIVSARDDHTVSELSTQAYWRLDGIPAGWRLTKGERTADGSWLVKVDQMLDLALQLPADFKGQTEFTLRVNYNYQDADGRVRTTQKDSVVKVTGAYRIQDPYAPWGSEDQRLGLDVLWNEGLRGQGMTIGISDGSKLITPDSQFDWSKIIAASTQPASALTSSSFGQATHATVVAGVMLAQHDGLLNAGVSPLSWLDADWAHHLDRKGLRVINLSISSVNRTLTEVGKDALDESYSKLYGGLGLVKVYGAGNFGWTDNTASMPFPSTRGVIAAGGVNPAGGRFFDTSWGDAVFISALGEGVLGGFPDNNGVAYLVSGQAGTSFAAPYVSAVVNLMLQAVPNLSVRDVKDILAYSAHQPSSGILGQLNGSDRANGGGLYHDEGIGFGIVNPLGAVRLAQSWILPGGANTAKLTTDWSALTVSGADDATPGWDLPTNKGQPLTINFNVSQPMDLEHVDVYLRLKTSYYKNLNANLISPCGTVAAVVTGTVDSVPSGVVDGTKEYKFGLSRFWGEHDEAGTWQLQFNYNSEGSFSGEVRSASIRFSKESDAQALNDRFVYTNDFFRLAALDANRLTLHDQDGGGINTVNLAAVSTSAIVADLNAGSINFSAWNKTVTIASDTHIQNLVGGELSDVIKGNDSNVLWGMNGADTLVARGAHNVLDGGDGDDLLLFSSTSDRVTGGQGNDLFAFYGDAPDDKLLLASLVDFNASQDFLLRQNKTDHKWQTALFSANDGSFVAWQTVHDSMLTARLNAVI